MDKGGPFKSTFVVIYPVFPPKLTGKVGDPKKYDHIKELKAFQ